MRRSSSQQRNKKLIKLYLRLGDTYKQLPDKQRESIQSCERALQMQEKLTGAESVKVAKISMRLAEGYFQIGKLEECVEYANRALQTFFEENEHHFLDSICFLLHLKIQVSIRQRGYEKALLRCDKLHQLLLFHELDKDHPLSVTLFTYLLQGYVSVYFKTAPKSVAEAIFFEIGVRIQKIKQAHNYQYETFSDNLKLKVLGHIKNILLKNPKPILSIKEILVGVADYNLSLMYTDKEQTAFLRDQNLQGLPSLISMSVLSDNYKSIGSDHILNENFQQANIQFNQIIIMLGTKYFKDIKADLGLEKDDL